MKQTLAGLIFLALGYVSKSQAYDSTANYGDTSITLTLTQRSAIYMGFYIKNNANIWPNRLTPTLLKPYVGTGTHLDSIFSVPIKAGYITGLIDVLLTGQNELVQADRLSIINNSPSIPGYTALATQIVSKAGGNTSEKNVASFILSYYNNKVASLAATRSSIISQVVQWTQN